MRVETFLDSGSRRYPGKIALVMGESRISYAELDDMSSRLANVLVAAGVCRGDRVVILAESSPITVASIFGCLKAGAVFVPINPGIKAEKLAFILNNCQARAVITPGLQLSMVRDANHQATYSPCTILVSGAAHGSDGAAGAGTQVPMNGDASLQDAMAIAATSKVPHHGIDTDLAMLIYTSGSTGFPKGVMMNHQNMVTASASITTLVENTSDDVIVSALPLFFNYGLYQVIMGIRMGATVVHEKSFAYPAAFIQRMQQERATGFPLVPTMAALLLNLRGVQPGCVPTLRYITNTAAALPPSHIRGLQDLFPSALIYSMYGITECKRCTCLPPSQLAIRPESVGFAIPNTEAYLVDDAGERLGPGSTGELVIRGGHVMQGYWGNPAATSKALRPDPMSRSAGLPTEYGGKVLYTGDLFRTDSDGYLYFVCRKDDIIKSKGEKVSPKEVENVLYAIPGVQEVAVIGVPDPMMGMAIKALIVTAAHTTLTVGEVLAYCARHLEDFMVPKLVEFRVGLPKTDTGKIQHHQLQAEALRPDAIASVV